MTKMSFLTEWRLTGHSTRAGDRYVYVLHILPSMLSNLFKVRVLHGPSSATTPDNEQNLYTLYVKAYAKAGFASRLEAHLPRHLIGYQQERLGVDKLETSRMGWRIGATYLDIYAPSIPKQVCAKICTRPEISHALYLGRTRRSWLHEAQGLRSNLATCSCPQAIPPAHVPNG